jgi:hypothetical protein
MLSCFHPFPSSPTHIINTAEGVIPHSTSIQSAAMADCTQSGNLGLHHAVHAVKNSLTPAAPQPPGPLVIPLTYEL